MNMSLEDARIIALAFMNFLLGEPSELERFVALTGMDIETIQNSIHSTAFQFSLLEYLLQNESLLLTFCTRDNISPEKIMPAAATLENSL